jgi:hypothetical protein
LPKIAENDSNLRKIVKTHEKGANNGCEGLLRAAGKKSFKKVATVQF